VHNRVILHILIQIHSVYIFQRVAGYESAGVGAVVAGAVVHYGEVAAVEDVEAAAGEGVGVFDGGIVGGGVVTGEPGVVIAIIGVDGWLAVGVVVVAFGDAGGGIVEDMDVVEVVAAGVVVGVVVDQQQFVHVSAPDEVGLAGRGAGVVVFFEHAQAVVVVVAAGLGGFAVDLFDAPAKGVVAEGGGGQGGLLDGRPRVGISNDHAGIIQGVGDRVKGIFDGQSVRMGGAHPTQLPN